MEQRSSAPADLATLPREEQLDRARLERDLRALTDALLELVPAQLRTFSLPAPVMAMLKMRGLSMAASLDLTSTAYATCSAIAALPEEDLAVILRLIASEVRTLRRELIRFPVEGLSDREAEAVGKVLGELRRGRA